MHRKACRDRLFDSVIHLSRSCLHGRFQSKYWEVPFHRGGPLAREVQGPPLHKRLKSSAQDFGRTSTVVFRSNISDLCALIERADQCAPGTDEELQLLKTIVKQCHAFCHPNGRTIEETVAFYGLKKQEALQNKSLRQVNKIGRYWGLCEDLTQASKKYGRLFETVNLQTVPRYQAYIPTPFTTAGRVTYHVHAEIQLIVFYDMNPSLGTRRPRVLGVSKAACYLCDLFILCHGQFKITKTHGTLYHQWNVPDLASYKKAQLLKYRRILAEMNSTVFNSIIRERQRSSKRPSQMESFVHLPAHFLTPSLSSDAGSVAPATMSDHNTAVFESTGQSNRLRSPDIPQMVFSSTTINDPRTYTNPRNSQALSGEKLDSTNNTSKTAQSSTKTLLAEPAPPETNTVTHCSTRAPSPTKLSPAENPRASTHSLQTISSAGAQLSVPNSPALNDQIPLSSPSTIDSWELPVRHLISPTHLLHSRTADLSLTFEIEAPARGEVIIENISEESRDTTRGHVIDPSALPIDEEHHLTRGEEEEDLVLILRFGDAHASGREQEQVTRVTLRWA